MSMTRGTAADLRCDSFARIRIFASMEGSLKVTSRAPLLLKMNSILYHYSLNMETFLNQGMVKNRTMFLKKNGSLFLE